MRGLTPEEVAPLAEELAAYAQHFAPFFYRRKQREWAAVYLRGLLTADVPRKHVEAMALRLLGVGSQAERQVRAFQQFIGEGAWDDEALLAEHQCLVEETLGEDDGVLNTLGSDSPKHGQQRAGCRAPVVWKYQQERELPGGSFPRVCQPQRSDLA